MPKLWCLIFLNVLLAASASAEINPWSAIARDDLNSIFKILEENHPGPVDSENVGFKKWFNQGFTEAQQKAAVAKNFEGYSFSLRYYVNGFKDGHLGLRIRLTEDESHWPGFVIANREDRFVVVSRSSGKEFGTMPALGAELISCDGHSPHELIKTNVFPFYGNENIKSHWFFAGPKILVDEGNPFIKRPQQCVFSIDNDKVSYSLVWRKISTETLDSMIKKAGFGERPPIEFREFGKNRFWTSFPNFAPEGQDLEQTHAVIKNIVTQKKKLQRAEIIVFDVRGNRGGNSVWGDQIVEALWGGKYAESRSRKGSDVDWRVSKDNVAYMKSLVPRLTKEFGKDSPFTAGFDGISKGMVRALGHGKKFYRQTGIVQNPVSTSIENPVKAKVFLLTDGGCASACLDFVDRLMSMGNMIHIGHPTSADSQYMEIRAQSLPSGIATLYFAIKAYRNRDRKANQAYEPKFLWKKDIDDTIALQKWILELASDGAGPFRK
jgi:hypothetical protein